MADHLGVLCRKNPHAVAVRFRGVRRFDWTFRHHDFSRFPIEVDQDHHLTWNIDPAEIPQAEVSHLTLSGSDQFPVLRIDFEGVNVDPVDTSTFADVNPDWSRPASGLARPSIERLHTLIKCSR